MRRNVIIFFVGHVDKFSGGVLQSKLKYLPIFKTLKLCLVLLCKNLNYESYIGAIWIKFMGVLL